MAIDSARPFQERMAFFWHSHFCSDLDKVESAVLMREQIDLWRREGLGNIRSLATTMSTQVAMIRYLDNNQNKASSPNQNSLVSSWSSSCSASAITPKPTSSRRLLHGPGTRTSGTTTSARIGGDPNGTTAVPSRTCER